MLFFLYFSVFNVFSNVSNDVIFLYFSVFNILSNVSNDVIFFFIFQYLTFCLMLVMIAVGVYIHTSSVVKLLVLFVMVFLHLFLVEVFFVDLYDNRDFLISANRGYVYS